MRVILFAGAAVVAALVAACASSPQISNSSARTIPFKIVSEFIVVPVSIAGAPAQDFILDTGAGVNVLSTPLCTPEICQITSHYSGKRMSGQAIDTKIATVTSLKLGDFQVSKVQAALFDMNQLVPEGKIAGILSLAFFRTQAVTLDFQKHVVILESQTPDGVSVPITLDDDGPSLGVHLPLEIPGGRKISVEVDTGSQGLILNEKFMHEVGISPQDPAVKKREGKDETSHAYVRYFAQLKGAIHPVGAPEISQAVPKVMFQKIIYDGLIGTWFLREFRVTFDLPTRRMIFNRL